MATRRQTNILDPSKGVARRAHRGLNMAGWLALLLGGALGFFQASSDLLEARIPFAVPPNVLTLAGMWLVGLLCGAVAGLWMRWDKSILRFLVALLAILIAVVSAQTVSGRIQGLPIIDSLSLFDDSVEALHIGLGALGAMIGIRTGRPPQWWRDARQSTPQQQATTNQTPQRTQSAPVNRRPAPRSAPTNRVRRSIRSISVPSIRLTGLSRRARNRAASGASALHNPARRLQVRRPAANRTPSGRHARLRSRANGRQDVHLGAEISSVCPYCLEEVHSNDPRGRVVCEICDAPHHGDCWAITGKCEVPHLQV